MKNVCPNCGTELPPKAKRCFMCGLKLSIVIECTCDEFKEAAKAGFKLPENAVCCPFCGKDASELIKNISDDELVGADPNRRSPIEQRRATIQRQRVVKTMIEFAKEYAECHEEDFKDMDSPYAIYMNDDKLKSVFLNHEKRAKAVLDVEDLGSGFNKQQENNKAVIYRKQISINKCARILQRYLQVPLTVFINDIKFLEENHLFDYEMTQEAINDFVKKNVGSTAGKVVTQTFDIDA